MYTENHENITQLVYDVYICYKSQLIILSELLKQTSLGMTSLCNIFF